ncbi:MAG: hypothetical protein AAGG06_18800, partial [Pseudomonadota bacterium]
RRDFRLGFAESVGRLDLLVELAGLVLLDPNPDQMPADVVLLRKRIERGAGKVLLDDLALEGGAVASVSADGLCYSECPASDWRIHRPNAVRR